MTQAPELDEGTADRLLDGSVAPHEAPLGWERVAALLRAAGAEGAPVDPPAELLAAMRVRPLSRRRRAAIAGGIAGALVFAGTGAAAANGSLPDAVQDVVHDVASVAGIDVPASTDRGRSDDAPGHDGAPGRSDEAPGRPTSDDHRGPGGRSEGAPGRPDDLPTVDAPKDESRPADAGRPADLPADTRPQATPATPATPPSTQPPATTPVPEPPPAAPAEPATPADPDGGRPDELPANERRNPEA